jgi:hypothetical protein
MIRLSTRSVQTVVLCVFVVAVLTLIGVIWLAPAGADAL